MEVYLIQSLYHQHDCSEVETIMLTDKFDLFLSKYLEEFKERIENEDSDKIIEEMDAALILLSKCKNYEEFVEVSKELDYDFFYDDNGISLLEEKLTIQ